MFGSEQIVFGTDYPFGLGQEGKQYVEHAVGVVDGSGLGEADLAKIYGGNARRLLHIEQL
jgi:predicted TIM-barrel fold metal-dependent hydrolase